MENDTAQYIVLPLFCLNIHLVHAVLYTHRLHGHKNWAAHGECALMSADPPNDEYDITRIVLRLLRNADGRSILWA